MNTVSPELGGPCLPRGQCPDDRIGSNARDVVRGSIERVKVAVWLVSPGSMIVVKWRPSCRCEWGGPKLCFELAQYTPDNARSV